MNQIRSVRPDSRDGRRSWRTTHILWTAVAHPGTLEKRFGHFKHSLLTLQFRCLSVNFGRQGKGLSGDLGRECGTQQYRSLRRGNLYQMFHSESFVRVRTLPHHENSLLLSPIPLCPSASCGSFHPEWSFLNCAELCITSFPQFDENIRYDQSLSRHARAQSAGVN